MYEHLWCLFCFRIVTEIVTESVVFLNCRILAHISWKVKEYRLEFFDWLLTHITVRNIDANFAWHGNFVNSGIFSGKSYSSALNNTKQGFWASSSLESLLSFQLMSPKVLARGCHLAAGYRPTILSIKYAANQLSTTNRRQRRNVAVNVSNAELGQERLQTN